MKLAVIIHAPDLISTNSAWNHYGEP